jgi:hypothetical protein
VNGHLGLGIGGGSRVALSRSTKKGKMKEVKIPNHAGIKPPNITHAFAVDKGYYGSIWKIYIEAEAPDGEMDKIAVVVHQTGYGYYPTDWIILRPRYRKHFRGYLQWNTFSSKASFLPEWTQITMKVSIFDKAGNESNEEVFPFRFQSGVKDQDEYPPPAPFDKRDVPRIGNIMIDLCYENR